MGSPDRVVIRPADLRDLDDLVELRLENGRVHAALDPVAHRVPDADAVRAVFTRRLTTGDADAEVVLVAELSGQVVGLVEVLIRALPLAGEILVPRRSAHIHTVVAPPARGVGAGRALVSAGEQWARTQGVEVVVAVIHAGNDPALAFYRDAGYGIEGVLTTKTIAVAAGNPDASPRG